MYQRFRHLKEGFFNRHDLGSYRFTFSISAVNYLIFFVSFSDGFDQQDIDRVKNRKKWLRSFLDFNDCNMTKSLDQLWETCIWRRKHNVNGRKIIFGPSVDKN